MGICARRMSGWKWTRTSEERCGVIYGKWRLWRRAICVCLTVCWASQTVDKTFFFFSQASKVKAAKVPLPPRTAQGKRTSEQLTQIMFNNFLFCTFSLSLDIVGPNGNCTLVRGSSQAELDGRGSVSKAQRFNVGSAPS